MKALVQRTSILLIILGIIPPLAAADKAKTLYHRGREAEAKQNYEQAYECYKQAYDLKPSNLSYRTSYERLRFLAGASHVHRGQLLREAGQLDAASAEFEKAVETDPSSAIAKQELQHTQQMIEAAKTSPKAAATPAPNFLEKRIQEAGGPVELTPISNVPINLKISGEDSKVVYETVGKLAGINVLFDPDYTSRRIKIELNNVSLEEALQIIAVETKTFWRPVTPNTIFIATDNPAKRKDLEQVVIKTFYLSNLSQPQELQDVTNTLRQILEIQRVQALPSEGAIVVRAEPDKMALAQKLVSDLDKSKAEVMVDVAVMQISRDKSRTLGINPPTSATVQLQPNVTSTTTPTTGSPSVLPSTSTTTPNGINLNTLGNLNATDFTVTISPATATALFTDSDTKLIQKPQIRAIEGQKASLKIGQRVPVATGSFQPGIGGVGINPLVNTQFQYLDVGVNIDLTPKVHANGDVTLKITMEVSEVDGTSNIGGITQPIIGQRKIEHEVRLREGEVNLLGGMMEDQQTRSLTGYPLLSQIPILRYLFGQTTTDHSETETVFALIPHVVRKQDITDLNQEALDAGTGSAISLRRVSHPAPTASPAVPNPSSQRPSQQSALPTTTSFAFDPATIVQPQGSTFAVNVMLHGAQNAYSVPFQVNYDPKTLQVVNVSNGTLLSQDGQAVALVKRDDDTTGTLQVTATRPPGAIGVSGQGTVATLTFMAKAAGQSTLTISKGGMRDPSMQPSVVAGASASVTIH
ncbi:MAG TPA: cohesin domain-containing protein [Terriglobales bacterium]|nr:cohesin domain-containing protein [Terriglobales bacterium]